MRVDNAPQCLEQLLCDPRIIAGCLGKLLRACAITLTILFSPASVADDTDLGARGFVESIGYTAQDILRSDRLNSDEKISSMQKLLQESVDLKLTGRRVLGAHWRTASEAQRSEYDDLFANYVLRIYPRALLRHPSQTFVVTGSKKSVGRDTLVFSRVLGPESQPIQWTWRVQEEDGDHKIIDLLADGISMTSTLQDEFKSHVFHHGFDGLLEKLRSVE